MLSTSISLGLLGFFIMVVEKGLTGTSMFMRPIIVGALTGIVMGDIPTGVIIGGTLELVFLGNVSIGASLPPEFITGTVLATAFSINHGTGVENAVTLGLPIATFMVMIQNVIFVFIYPLVIKAADKLADNGEADKLGWLQFITGFFTRAMPIGLVIGLSYYFGSSAISSLLDMIPNFVKDGMRISTGIMPALGFAILLRMMLNKSVAVFYILGFILAAYLKLPSLAIAILGVIIAIIIVSNRNQIKTSTSTNSSYEEDDDF
ncbi:PTS sugar transporter subunit IIC [Brachyspira sp.]|uniref:PTS mannose/fructose/sorbose/N-acetylgalactosamine transporter subunit IIC n=1 Tax=Brachyspira sp. TaxID=1977261 RepID=UPI0026028575|nr:PTS sugar transporter subunit IIC [Brachyspira sp.]